MWGKVLAVPEGMGHAGKWIQSTKFSTVKNIVSQTSDLAPFSKAEQMPGARVLTGILRRFKAGETCGPLVQLSTALESCGSLECFRAFGN